MRPNSRLDRETFQQLLASAYAVQESQIDTQSLSSIVELQRLVARGELDVDGAMRGIVEAVSAVANASGVAIGLLTGDQLTYRAGSGSAVADVGRQVRASLTFSADARTGREILRVENAQSDTRIQAAICRQFGAVSLLILPICQGHALAGVLEVRFSEPHTFDDREVRAYRLMAGVVEGALSKASELEQKKKLAAAPATLRPVAKMPPQRENPFDNFGVLPVQAGKRPVYQRGGAAPALVHDSQVVKRPALLARTLVQRAKEVNWYRRPNVALAAIAAVLVLTLWVAYGRRAPVLPAPSSAATRPGAIEQQAAIQPAKGIPASSAVDAQTFPVSESRSRHPATAGRRVQVSENEVDYIRGDVTVRYFTYKKPAPKPLQQRAGDARVAHIGDDVTVRYFPPQPGGKAATR
jgi:hypothetical protein